MRTLLLVMVAFAAACGDDDFNELPDAPVFPDGPPVDTPTAGLVKIRITVGTTARTDIKVYFQNSDSTLVVAGVTDANGEASAVMEPGGFVTAIDPFPSRGLPSGAAPPQDLMTFSGVKPGDELVLHRPDAGATINFNLLANLEPTQTATNYTLFGPCIFGGIDVTNGASGGSGSIGGAISLQGCGSNTDLTIVSANGSGTLSSVHKGNLSLVEGQDVDMTDAVYVNVDPAVTFEYTDAPASIGSFDAFNVLLTARGRQVETLQGAIVTSGTGITTGVPRAVIDGSLSVVAGRLFGPTNSNHRVIEWNAATSAYTKSLASTLLDEYTSDPTYDLANKQVTWTADAAGVDPDLVVVNASFQRETPAFQQWSWDIVGPSTGTALRFPVLPAPDDGLNPAVGDSLQDVNELITAKVPGGYDAVREVVFSVNDEGTGLPLGIITGASGQIVLQELSRNKGKRTRPTVQQVLSPFAHRPVVERKRRR